MHIQLTFAKTLAMRYTSHLDLMRALERTFRRAELPLAYTQGYNPHPRINLISALPLGFTSECEIADVQLEASIPAEEIQTALQQAAPPGIEILSVEEITGHQPAMQTLHLASLFIVTLPDPPADLESRIEILLARTELTRQRRAKSYNLRPLIETLYRLEDNAEGHARLRMRLAARQGATGRPEEVLEALGIAAHNARIHKIQMVFIEQQE